jgi:poly-beta-hydroxyalkanoate depolymerase
MVGHPVPGQVAKAGRACDLHPAPLHHMQAGIGHDGVFSGKRWNNEIYPLLRDFVHVNS